MKNTIGTNVTVTIYGESHGSGIGAVIDGLSPGIRIDEEYIKHQLDLRRPSGAISTSRVEADEYVIKSGIFNGYTTGTPICIDIPNTNTRSKDYSKTRNLARPGHADYTANVKYKGYEDYRGGGHFSGRLTAAIVAAGAICSLALRSKGIKIGTHILTCLDIKDREFDDLEKDIDALNEKEFAVLNEDIRQPIIDSILNARSNTDSLGAILQTAIINVPAGVGEPYFDSVESKLAHGLFSIPAVKGVEFGKGFKLAEMTGKEANDPFRIEDDKVYTTTNNNGGINGGITNGMPILFNLVIKPTPSIMQKQDTVDFINRVNSEILIEGRHDPAIFHRARVVVDSIAAIVLVDMLETSFGEYYFGE